MDKIKENIVKITFIVNRKEKVLGTGFFISNEGHVLTAYHLINGISKYDHNNIRISGKECQVCKQQQYNEKGDFVILKIKDFKKSEIYQINTKYKLSIHDKLFGYGFGSTDKGEPDFFEGKVTGNVYFQTTFTTATGTRPIIKGDSGSPIIINNHIVGWIVEKQNKKIDGIIVRKVYAYLIGDFEQIIEIIENIKGKQLITEQIGNQHKKKTIAEDPREIKLTKPLNDNKEKFKKNDTEIKAIKIDKDENLEKTLNQKKEIVSQNSQKVKVPSKKRDVLKMKWEKISKQSKTFIITFMIAFFVGVILLVIEYKVFIPVKKENKKTSSFPYIFVKVYKNGKLVKYNGDALITIDNNDYELKIINGEIDKSKSEEGIEGFVGEGKLTVLDYSISPNSIVKYDGNKQEFTLYKTNNINYCTFNVFWANGVPVTNKEIILTIGEHKFNIIPTNGIIQIIISQFGLDNKGKKVNVKNVDGFIATCNDYLQTDSIIKIIINNNRNPSIKNKLKDKLSIDSNNKEKKHLIVFKDNKGESGYYKKIKSTGYLIHKKDTLPAYCKNNNIYIYLSKGNYKFNIKEKVINIESHEFIKDTIEITIAN